MTFYCDAIFFILKNNYIEQLIITTIFMIYVKNLLRLILWIKDFFLHIKARFFFLAS